MATTKVNVTGMLRKLDLSVDVIQDEAIVLLEQAAEIGRDASRQALDLAITPYGRKRFAAGRGNSAGRNDTGSMINDLQALDPVVKANEISIKFGWGRGRSKRYYKFQEEGTGRIKAANSLLTGEKAVLNQLPRLERNMKARIRRKLRKQ
jgi:hypothetical protein